METSVRIELLKRYLGLLDEVDSVERALGIGQNSSRLRKQGVAPQRKKKKRKSPRPSEKLKPRPRKLEGSRVVKFQKGSAQAKKIQRQVREWREAQELTQKEASKVLGMSAGTYAGFETERSGVSEGLFTALRSKAPGVVRGM